MADEASIAALVKNHKERRDAKRLANDRKLREVLSVVPQVSTTLVENVNKDVLDIFTNQHVLESETKELQAQADRFYKQSQGWLALFESFNNSLKELGDMANWATVIESDARETVRALDEMTRTQKNLKALEGS
eukprot:TRINITY_DN38695_c0_g1_i1.p1 TRINITY_DN38695_c0_g1~~TRINITY_DN38695_c0_g1_i1.p1  ORF type:complete len:151 (+),score=50.29 TRINITY_DN38695_c0_g1_i1:53-454(+)